MESLKIQSTADSPNVTFNQFSGTFEISKRSLPENPIQFYEPLLNYINDYFKSPKEETIVTFHFDYISSSSTKQVMKMILMFDQLAKTKTVKLYWKYDKGDMDMLQLGNRLEKLANLKFIYTEV